MISSATPDYKGPPRNQIKNSDSPVFLEIHKGKVKVIIGIALLAIGALVAGGVLLYFKENTTVAWVLITGGGVLSVGDLVAGVVIYVRHKRSTPQSLSKEEIMVCPPREIDVEKAAAKKEMSEKHVKMMKQLYKMQHSCTGERNPLYEEIKRGKTNGFFVSPKLPSNFLG